MLNTLLNEQNNSKSLENLLTINKNINERKFHNHTYILYDLRTLLGNTPKTYLEIGTYIGSSASLILSHPFQTELICIDPCILPKHHFNGTKDQYNTIIDNLQKNSNVNNGSNFKVYNNFSTDNKLLNKLYNDKITVDILFIDGDHSYQGVMNDWNNYNKLVNKGGFIIFDDYNDSKYSPEVKIAVDSIVKNLNKGEYEIIGDIPNIHNLDQNNNNYVLKNKINEFIIYKK